MSIASVITGGFGQSVALIITDGYSIGTATVVPASIIAGSGSGKYKWSDDELAQYLDGLSSGWAKDAYEEIIEIAPSSVKKEAKRIVEQFSSKDRIDWLALETNLLYAALLLEVYEAEILDRDREEEEILMLLM